MQFLSATVKHHNTTSNLPSVGPSASSKSTSTTTATTPVTTPIYLSGQSVENSLDYTSAIDTLLPLTPLPRSPPSVPSSEPDALVGTSPVHPDSIG